VTPRRLRWTVLGLVVLALLGTVVAFRLASDVGISEVWRTDTGTELRREPGGDVLDEYILMPCTDPSGKRVDYVARRRSHLDGPAWTGQGVIHRLDETETVVEAGGERWRRFLVRQEGLTPEEVPSDLSK
jgi:hypothetical protein